MIGWILLGIFLLFVLILVIRALRFKPEVLPPVAEEPVALDHDKIVQDMADMIRCATVSYQDEDLIDRNEFAKFEALLPERFPRIYAACSFEKVGKTLRLPFSVCANKLTEFSLGDRAVADKMGYREPGVYKCASSGAWVSENQFYIMCQVIDTYMGGLYITISFKGEKATFVMKNSGQYVFENADGYAIGIME